MEYRYSKALEGCGIWDVIKGLMKQDELNIYDVMFAIIGQIGKSTESDSDFKRAVQRLTRVYGGGNQSQDDFSEDMGL